MTMTLGSTFRTPVIDGHLLAHLNHVCYVMIRIHLKININIVTMVTKKDNGYHGVMEGIVVVMVIDEGTMVTMVTKKDTGYHGVI